MIQGTVKIYNSSNPDNFDTKGEPIAETPISDQAARVKINQNLHRQYFLVRFDDKYDMVTSKIKLHTKFSGYRWIQK